jgi:hypothetical protein
MSKRTSRPEFLGGDGSSFEGEYLLEEKNSWVLKQKELITLDHCGLWTKRETALAWRYKVNSVTVTNLQFGKRKSADWLLDLPPLRRLSISLWIPVDIKALERLTDLRELRIDFDIWRVGDQFQPVDLTGLHKLQFADVMMCRAVESILQCESIVELTVGNECDGRLRDLDLSRLRSLYDLGLDHCAKLSTVKLHPKAKIRGLALTSCGAYKIDWPRVGPDLRYLMLGSRLTFPLREILNAPGLIELHTSGIRKFPPLGFRRRLRHLRTVFIFTPPPGPKLSKEDWALIRKINGGKA